MLNRFGVFVLTELDEVMKRSSEHDFVGLANQRLVSTLTKNLANMEHFSKRDAVSFIYFRLQTAEVQRRKIYQAVIHITLVSRYFYCWFDRNMRFDE